LAVIPGNYLPGIDMGLVHGLGQPIFVNEGGVPIVPQQQNPSKTRSQAKGVNPEIGQINQVKGIGQHQKVEGMGLEVEFL
jgi:hypothetical protein